MNSRFTRLLVLLACLLASYWCTAQQIIGTVIDKETKELLPFVNVYFEAGTGTYTNEQGKFDIAVEADKDSLYFSLLGYQAQVYAVANIKGSLKVKLEPTSIGLDVVEIKGKKENLGKSIMRRVIEEKKRLATIEDNFAVDCYRSTQSEYFHKASERDTSGLEEGWHTGAFFEELATHYRVGKDYKKIVKAELNNVEKESLKASSGFNIDDSFSGGSTWSTYNPIDIFLQPSDIFTSQYDNVWKNPNLSDRPISSITSNLAFATYNFTLSDIAKLPSGDSIFTIKVEPVFKQSASYSGQVVIDGRTNRMIASVLEIDDGLVSGLKNLEISTKYESSKDAVRPSEHAITYDYNLGRDKYRVTTHLNFRDRVDAPPVPNQFFTNEVVRYTEESLERDFRKWDDLRSTKLDSSLLGFIVEQDSIYEYEHSVEYYRIQDSIYNDNGIMDYLFRGFGWKKRAIGLTTSFDPAVTFIQLNFIGGIRYNFGARIEKEFLSGNNLNVGGFINYGPNNQDLKGRLALSYTYLPRKFARFHCSIGDMYDIITEQETFESIISPRNIINVRDLSFGHAFEIVNGLYLDVTTQYAVKESIGDLELPEWIEIFGGNSEPLDFQTYRSFFINTELIYKFKQRYITRGRRKLLLSNHSPTIKLTFRHGIPGIFNSEVDFSQLTLDVYQTTKPTRIGTTNWRLTGGIFPHKRDIRYIENVFFRGQNLIFFSNPLTNLQRLDRTVNTNSPYARGGVIHHFDGFLLDKIPLINRLQMEVIGGAAALALSDTDYGQLELYVGLGKKFKLFRETVQVAVYRVSAIDTNKRWKGGYVIGFNIYDPFNAQWLY